MRVDVFEMFLGILFVVFVIRGFFLFICSDNYVIIVSMKMNRFSRIMFL